MKDWLTIGDFSKRVSLSQKTLRLYEKAGLIRAHSRGDNRYRYYRPEQIALVERIKQFKSFGFTLREIRSLLTIDPALDAGKLAELLNRRLAALAVQERGTRQAQSKIRGILTSLTSEQPGLNPDERRFIMKQIENVSVIVAGARDLEPTAEFIKRHIEKSGKKIPVILWDGVRAVPVRKPYILVISEENLRAATLPADLNPDVVVIKEVSASSAAVQRAYLQLFRNVGAHVTTILNADDRALVHLAGNGEIQKGRMYYFSKNEGLEDQIVKIGGVISDGDKVKVYGRNPMEIELGVHFGHADEIAYLASVAAVMDFGIRKEALG